jgi:hypothetical protein
VSDPVFPGVDALLTLVRMLVRRPRLWERDEDLEKRGDLPLPLVCLIREPGADGFLRRLDRAFAAKLRRPPVSPSGHRARHAAERSSARRRRRRACCTAGVR